MFGLSPAPNTVPGMERKLHSDNVQKSAGSLLRKCDFHLLDDPRQAKNIVSSFK